ncbi:unnamed protein product, partial [Psylliodes chrysocephalus]
MHHPNSAIERISLPIDVGGVGILDIHRLHQSQIKALRQYFHEKSTNHALFRAVCQADTKSTPLKLSDIEYDPEDNRFSTQSQIQRWKQKELHGSHAHHLLHENTDTEASNLYLRGTLFAETVGFIGAIQDRVMNTRNYQKYILKNKNIVDKCRRCGSPNETIEHIICGCETLAPMDYTQRHNNVARIIHQQLAKNF